MISTLRYAPFITLLLVLIAGLRSPVAHASENVPPVAASVSIVSSGPSAGDGHFRLIISVSEIYHHVFVDWVALGEEGSSATVTNRYAVQDEDLGGYKLSVKHIADVRWVDYQTVRLRVNDRTDCTLRLSPSRYEAACE